MTDLAARALYRDTHLIVLDKPAGLAVHPGPRTPDSLEQQLWQLRFGNRGDPQPVHRLDRDTSGCLVLGRHPKAVKRLGALFAAAAVDKRYWAIVEGAPADDVGLIEAALAKISSAADGWRMVVDPGGKAAATEWRVLERGARSLIEFRPRTGRTHQVRVHAAALGCVIIGDPVYGKPGGPMRLHARSVGIPYADGAPPIVVEAPVPADWPPVGR